MSARVFCPEERKEEAKKNEIREEGETIELYPKGGLMIMHSDKFSDKETENNVGKLQNLKNERHREEMEEITIERRNKDAETLRRGREEIDRSNQKNKEKEALLEKMLQTIQRLELEVKERRKTTRNEEEKIDFFPQWKPPQGLIGET